MLFLQSRQGTGGKGCVFLSSFPLLIKFEQLLRKSTGQTTLSFFQRLNKKWSATPNRSAHTWEWPRPPWSGGKDAFLPRKNKHNIIKTDINQSWFLFWLNIGSGFGITHVSVWCCLVNNSNQTHGWTGQSVHFPHLCLPPFRVLGTFPSAWPRLTCLCLMKRTGRVCRQVLSCQSETSAPAQEPVSSTHWLAPWVNAQSDWSSFVSLFFHITKQMLEANAHISPHKRHTHKLSGRKQSAYSVLYLASHIPFFYGASAMKTLFQWALLASRCPQSLVCPPGLVSMTSIWTLRPSRLTGSSEADLCTLQW